MTEWTQGNEREVRAGGRRPRRHHAAGRLRGGADAGLEGRARSTASPTISERHRHRYEVNIGYREAFEARRPEDHRPLARRRAARDRRARGPSLVHRRAVPPGAEEPPVRARTPCSPASSPRRWSRAGWCERRGRARIDIRRLALALPEARRGRSSRHPLVPGGGKIFCDHPPGSAADDGEARHGGPAQPSSRRIRDARRKPCPAIGARKGSTFVSVRARADAALIETLLGHGLRRTSRRSGCALPAEARLLDGQSAPLKPRASPKISCRAS